MARINAFPDHSIGHCLTNSIKRCVDASHIQYHCFVVGGLPLLSAVLAELAVDALAELAVDASFETCLARTSLSSSLSREQGMQMKTSMATGVVITHVHRFSFPSAHRQQAHVITSSVSWMWTLFMNIAIRKCKTPTARTSCIVHGSLLFIVLSQWKINERAANAP
jgi:hypothetical protein